MKMATNHECYANYFFKVVILIFFILIEVLIHI